MTPEYLFNSQVLRNIFQNQRLAVKTGRDVSASPSPVTAVTSPGEIRPYALSFRIAKFTSGIGIGSW
jgi:hypothetical protein